MLYMELRYIFQMLKVHYKLLLNYVWVIETDENKVWSQF